VAERVRFVGAVPHDRIGPYFADADILVNSSLDDNFPMPVIEGMAAGLPVVAPRIGGLPEAIEHGETGLLIEPEDPGGLAAALLELLDDDGRRRAMGRAAHRRAAEVFSWERITDELVGLYDEVLAAPSHRGSR
jgi:D-inositol-3-phosphate glycosyltransferase